MDTYEKQHSRWTTLGVAAATAAFLGRKKIAAYAMRGMESLAARTAAIERTNVRFSLTHFADDVGRVLDEVIPTRAKIQVGEQRLRQYLGWTSKQADLLFGYEKGIAPYDRLRQWITPKGRIPDIADEAYSNLRASLHRSGKSMDQITAELATARQRLADDRLFSKTLGLPTDPRTKSIQAQVARVQEEHKRLLTKALEKRSGNKLAARDIALGQRGSWAEGIAERAFGMRRVTVGEVLENRTQFATDVITQAEYTQAKLLKTLGKSSKDVLHNAVLGELWTNEAGNVFDLRNTNQLWNNATRWLNDNIEIPLIPFVGGFSPFRLFPWLTGESSVTHTLIRSNMLGKQALVKGMFSEGVDISLLGHTAIGMRFGDALRPEQAVTNVIEGMTALHADYGFGQRIMRNLEANQRAMEDVVPREGFLGRILDATGYGTGGSTRPEKIRNFLSLNQAEESVWTQFRSIFTKFADPSKFPEGSELYRIAKTYPAGAIKRLYTNLNISPSEARQDLTTMANFLKRSGEFSPELAKRTFQSGMFAGSPMEAVMRNLTDDAAVVKFFRENRSYGLTASSKKLAIMLEDFSVDPGAVLGKLHRRFSRSPDLLIL